MPAIRCGSRAQVSLDTARLKLLFDQNLAPRLVGKPKVVWVRLGNCTTDDVVGLLELRHRRLLEFDDQPEVAFLASLTAGAPPTTAARLAPLPLTGRCRPLGNLGMFIVPAFILAMAMAGTTMRMTRAMMLEVLRQDYIRTAWSKGLRQRAVVIGHALQNALIPVVTIVGASLPVMVGGAVIIEQIFALPGLGRLALDALQRRDYTLVSGINLVIATAVVLANLLVDLSYAFLDPRVRYR